jgi:UDP:flavonoid glycosyltransferase YjiC (YdhE family)
MLYPLIDWPNMRILFTTNPLYGHLYPMLPLMNAARRADYEVIVATGANFAQEVERHGFPIWSVGPSAQQVQAQSATTDDDQPMDQLGQMVEAGMRLFGRPGIARARDLTPLAADWKPDIVVHELTEAAGWQAAAVSGAIDVMHGFGTHIPYHGLSHSRYRIQRAAAADAGDRCGPRSAAQRDHHDRPRR